MLAALMGRREQGGEESIEHPLMLAAMPANR
jgi:hypothetical protein